MSRSWSAWMTLAILAAERWSAAPPPRVTPPAVTLVAAASA